MNLYEYCGGDPVNGVDINGTVDNPYQIFEYLTADGGLRFANDWVFYKCDNTANEVKEAINSIRTPDYYVIHLQVKGDENQIFSWAPQVVIDRYGAVYFTPLGFGASSPGSLVSGDVCVGYLPQEDAPSPIELRSYLTGLSVGGSLSVPAGETGVSVCAGVSYSPYNDNQKFSLEAGLASSPGLSGSVVWQLPNFELYNGKFGEVASWAKNKYDNYMSSKTSFSGGVTVQQWLEFKPSQIQSEFEGNAFLAIISGGKKGQLIK